MSSPGSATVKAGTWQWWQSPWQPLLFWLSLVSPGLEEYTGSDLTVNCRIVGLPSSIQCCPHTCDHPDVCLLHLHDSLTKRHRRQWVLEGKAIGIPDIVYYDSLLFLQVSSAQMVKRLIYWLLTITVQELNRISNFVVSSRSTRSSLSWGSWRQWTKFHFRVSGCYIFKKKSLYIQC